MNTIIIISTILYDAWAKLGHELECRYVEAMLKDTRLIESAIKLIRRCVFRNEFDIY